MILIHLYQMDIIVLAVANFFFLIRMAHQLKIGALDYADHCLWLLRRAHTQANHGSTRSKTHAWH